MTQEFSEEIKLHNSICMHSLLCKPEWLGCPYPVEKRSFNPQLYRCNLCDIEFLQVIVGNEVQMRHWRKYLHERKPA